MAGSPFVVWLEEIAEGDTPRVGAKAARIAALKRRGFTVPDGFVVTLDAHRAFEEACGRSAAAGGGGAPSGLDPGGDLVPDSVGDAIRRAYLDLAARTRSGGLVAVRSSGILEDLDHSSFAGQYRTDLGVRGEGPLLASVAGCWLSGTSKGVERYREARGLGNGDSGMGVIVQELIPAEASGVLFTADPMTGRPDRIAVDCAWGLGEIVVTGAVVPDHFVLDRESFAVREKRLGTKDRLIAPAPGPDGGTEEREVPEPKASAPCLTSEQLATLASVARRIEQEMGMPQDIEWSLAGGLFYLLQSRPITARAQTQKPAAHRERGSLETEADPVFPVYTTAGIREMLPGVLTPLTWSFVGPPMESAYQESVRRLGLVGGHLPEHAFLGFFYGRPSLNLSRQRLLSTLLPGGTPSEASKELAGPGAGGAAHGGAPVVPLGWRSIIPLVGPVRLRVRSWLGAVLLARAVHNEAARLEVQVAGGLWEAGMRDSAIQSPEACLTELRSLREGLARVCALHVASTLVAAQMHDWLARLMNWKLGPDSMGTREALLAGLDLPVGADAHEALWRVSREIGAIEGARGKIRQWARIGFRGMEREGTPEAMRLARLLKGFLVEHGYKGFGGVELRAPSWRDDPGPLLQIVGSIASSTDGEVAPSRFADRREALREAARVRVASSRGLGLRRIVLGRLLRWTRELLGLRERLKDLVMRVADHGRILSRRLGAACAEKGILAKADDVYFLTIEEIEGVLEDEGKAGAVRGVVRERRVEWAEYESVGIPEVFRGRPDPYPDAMPRSREPGGKLAGIGVSPGRVAGRARVATSPQEACAVRRGEILVARSADASWAPLMLLAGGLVTEVGGFLSHGSILAREFALPAMAGVRDATRLVRTGDEMILDASGGWLQILDGESPG